MKKSGLIILVLSFVLLVTAFGVGAMSMVERSSVDHRSGVNAKNYPEVTARQLGAETHHEAVNMVFVGTVDPVPGAKAAEGLVSLLEEQTGYSFNAIWSDSLSAAVELMVAGDADFGWLPAMTYVMAHELGCVQVKLVAERMGQTFYRGQFIVRKDSGLDSLADLARKNFAFSNPGSSSGYLYPSLHIVNTQGMMPDDFFATTLFADGHAGVVNAVYNGAFDGIPVDGGATFEDARVLVDKEISETLKIIDLTEKIPNDTVTVRPGLDSTVVQTVIDGLTAIAGTPEWSALMSDLYLWGDVAPAEDSDYDIVRQAMEVFNQVEFFTCSTIVELDAGGGLLTHTNKSGLTTTVQVAAGTFTETVELNYAQVLAAPHLPRGFLDPGGAFYLTAVISSTGKNVAAVSTPYQVAASYDEDELGGLHENELALYSWDGAGWVMEPTSRVDPENNLVLANPDHFSLFAVLGSKKTFLPVVIGG